MTKSKVYDKRVLSPKAVEKSCGKPGKFAGKEAMGKVVREFSKCVFHKLWRKRWHKMALFCGYRGETAHFRGYMVVRCWFFHKAGGKCRGVIRKGNTFPQARWISTERVECWIWENDRYRESVGFVPTKKAMVHEKLLSAKPKKHLTNGKGYGILFSYTNSMGAISSVG